MEPPVVPGLVSNDVGPTFRRYLKTVLPLDGDALDLGTGTGRVALELAPNVRHVIGIDLDASALEAAWFFARRANITNVAFVHQDAERADLLALNGGRPFQLVTARLFFSLPVLGHVAAVLAPGGHFIVEALEERHWGEAGGSRFNVPAATAITALEREGLRIVDACVETAVLPLGTVAEARAHLKETRLWTKWNADGRWKTLEASIRRGSRSLTEAHLVFHARSPTA